MSNNVNPNTETIEDPSSEILRNAGLSSLAGHLATMHDRKHDVVISADDIQSEGDDIVLTGADQDLTPEGVTDVDYRVAQTDQFRGSIATKLGIPTRYANRLWESPTLRDTYHTNINALLGDVEGKRYMVRTFKARGDAPAVARVLLSDQYQVMDHLPVIDSALSALQDMDIDFEVIGCDLSPRNMFVKVRSQAVAAMAPKLLEGYVSPFTGNRGTENPMVFAGFVLQNSETGQGQVSVVPRIEFEVCRNGMVRKEDAFRKTHLGAKLEVGAVAWSSETQEKNRELVKAQVKDVVGTCMKVEYLERVIAEVTEKADTALVDPGAVVVKVGGALKLNDAERDGLVRNFNRGHQDTAGGVMQAFTALAQEIVDPDRANEIEGLGLEALELAIAR